MTNQLSMDQAFIKQLDERIQAHLEDEQFGVHELAQAMGMCRSHLYRKLQSLKGKSVSQFIREYRLGKAMELLQNNVATASEIAYRVGFGSPTYFNTSFREFYGYPPGEVKFRGQDSFMRNEEDQIFFKIDVSVQRGKRQSKQRMFFISLFGLILMAFLLDSNGISIKLLLSKFKRQKFKAPYQTNFSS